MFPFCKKKRPNESDAVEVGWVIDPNREASFIWDTPHKLPRSDLRTSHAKGISKCPAINDLDSRIIEVRAPIDLHVRFHLDQKGDPTMSTVDGEMSTIRTQFVPRMVMAMNNTEWRHPNRPLLQVITPYIFVADEPVYINLMPAFYHIPANPLPGIVLGGRFPIDIWPRELAWAFEWVDTTKNILINRGDPWFYLTFETQNPDRRVRLVEAEMTPALREYANGIRGVTNYVSNTYSLFETARQRRPQRLLVPKKR